MELIAYCSQAMVINEKINEVLDAMRMFDFESANKWLTENWDAIKASQYIDYIKRCIEKEKATDGNQ